MFFCKGVFLGISCGGILAFHGLSWSVAGRRVLKHSPQRPCLAATSASVSTRAFLAEPGIGTPLPLLGMPTTLAKLSKLSFTMAYNMQLATLTRPIPSRWLWLSYCCLENLRSPISGQQSQINFRIAKYLRRKHMISRDVDLTFR